YILLTVPAASLPSSLSDSARLPPAPHPFPTRRSSDLHTPEGSRQVPGFPVTEIDPTGAGDSFGATFCTLRSRGMTAAEALVYARSEEHTSELQSRFDLVCRLLLEINKEQNITSLLYSH